MPIKYRGSGTTQDINLLLYGDGTSSSVDINLSQAPFCIDFKGLLPSFAYLVGEQNSGDYPDLTSISIIAGTPPTSCILRFRFASPLPAVTFGQADEVGGPSSAINLSIRFIYG